MDDLEYGVSGDDGATVVYVGEQSAALRSWRDLGGYDLGARVYARRRGSGRQTVTPTPASRWTEVLLKPRRALR